MLLRRISRTHVSTISKPYCFRALDVTLNVIFSQQCCHLLLLGSFEDGWCVVSVGRIWTICLFTADCFLVAVLLRACPFSVNCIYAPDGLFWWCLFLFFVTLDRRRGCFIIGKPTFRNEKRIQHWLPCVASKACPCCLNRQLACFHR